MLRGQGEPLSAQGMSKKTKNKRQIKNTVRLVAYVNPPPLLRLPRPCHAARWRGEKLIRRVGGGTERHKDSFRLGTTLHDASMGVVFWQSVMFSAAFPSDKRESLISHDSSGTRHICRRVSVCVLLASTVLVF